MTCSNFVCLRPIRINFCVVTCSSLCVCMCVCETCLHYRSFVWPLTQQWCAGLGLLSLVSPPDLSGWVGGWVSETSSSWMTTGGRKSCAKQCSGLMFRRSGPCQGLKYLNIWRNFWTWCSARPDQLPNIRLKLLNLLELYAKGVSNFMRKGFRIVLLNVFRISCERFRRSCESVWNL